jgi:hypothetical protein
MENGKILGGVTDYAGVTYGSALPPDEVTSTDNAAIDAATAWLMTQPSCTMPGGD